MTDNTLIIESLTLMGIGMGIVFGFLLLLVGILRTMSWVAGRLLPMPPAPDPVPPVLTPSTHGSGDTAGSDDLIAVIAAAVARYRTRP
ncbi:sodium pump decarboxylase subunit gamma [Thiohalocapsa marina]|uniref:Probable oxaloacetate decarboxylase gamma chain n=1 Tax=Thiohalocapsa marina TaxID=424902 RepID=A0A5M8FSA5_9GAMM|nr:OadG family protein [Thiohalocapsa marina]KAA6186315.1 sodium pump decarboxylase subunit gamma [Thiohalocapsa marina]